MPSPSRRDVLAATGVLAGLGAGYYVGATHEPTTGPRPLSWADTDWPYPDYDAANTRNPPAASAPSGDDLTVAWRRRLDDVLTRSRPVVANGNVCVASTDGSTGRLRAFSTADGEEVWRREDHINGYISPLTVVAPGTSLYYRFSTFTDAPLGAVDQSTGDQVWGAAIPPSGLWMVGGGRVYYWEALNEELQTYDARTGDVLWTANAPEFGLLNTYHAEYGLLGGWHRTLRAYDAEDGSERWSAPFETRDPRKTVIAGGLAVTTKWFWADNDVVAAFDAADGTEVWRYKSPEDDGDGSYGLAAGSDNVVIVVEGVSDAPNGLSAVEAATGDRRWRVTAPKLGTGLGYPTIVGDSVYVCGVRDGDSRSSELRRFSLDDGTRTGSWPLPDDPDALVVADGQVLVQTETELVAYE